MTFQKKLMLTSICIALTMTLIHAQKCFNPAGGVATGSGGTVSYSVGQNFNSTNSNGLFSISQGAQQPTEYSASLPIELLSFQVVLKENSFAEITWVTITEINNDFFTIERSKDGVVWEKLKEIDAVGNSITTQDYYSEDENPYFGTSYYRLKQTDFDGQFSYSNVVTIERSGNEKLTVFPNPTQQNFTVNIEGTNPNDFDYQLFNIHGQVIFSKNILENQTEVNLENFPIGIYFIQKKKKNHKIKSFKIIKLP